mmetsp:Transcript_17347/g.29679  ORF Transcript_17347/g.29679 Transcript_17347/m.29679 type:complete len:437 (+) Transcript_17347:99-1409(+)
MDVKDILGMSRGGATGPGEGKPEHPHPKVVKPKMKRPEGMSREAFALLGDSHPIIVTQLMPKKKEAPTKAKPSTKGFVTWSWRPITSSARNDDLQILHWWKGHKDAAGRMKEPDETDYFFAKYNKKVQLSRYTNEEYDSLVKASSGDWSKAETDYLFDFCERFDLRFIVIADRYEFVPPFGAPVPPPRDIEDLKDRYYSIARRLLVSREGSEAAVANQVLLKQPFNKANERQRKAAVEGLLLRTRQETDEENAILAEARIIEDRRRAEADKAKKVAENAEKARHAAANAAAAAAAAAGNPITQRLQGVALGEVRFPDNFSNDPGLDQPSLFNESLQPSKPPKPSVYARGLYTVGLANQLQATMPTRTQKAMELALQDPQYMQLAVVPRHSSRAVCGMWLAARQELMGLQELRRMLPPGSSKGVATLGHADQKKRKR